MSWRPTADASPFPSLRIPLGSADLCGTWGGGLVLGRWLQLRSGFRDLHGGRLADHLMVIPGHVLG